MWFPKPVYELLPYLYTALGAAFIALSWFGAAGWVSAVLLVCGSGLTMIGLILWLRRRDFRDTQQHYTGRLPDD